MPRAMHALGYSDLAQVPSPLEQSPLPLPAVVVSDYRNLSESERIALAAAYDSRHGLAHFVVANPDDKGGAHPLLEIADQLKDRLPLEFPVTHPMEGHPEATARFGAADGTLKLYDLTTRDGQSGYREQAETADMFDAHNDGLGYGGAVEAFAFYADSAALWGGYTYFQNIIDLSLYLAATDSDAFASLFLPDAITALRPRGKGAIEVVSPILFINEFGRPQSFFRIASGEYRISWRSSCSPLLRAVEFLTRHCQPFAAGTRFVHLDRRGVGCIGRNEWLVHGRTAFVDGQLPEQRRVLARKWYMSAPEHTRYKHVPGMHILREFAAIYPEKFSAERLVGHWNYDPVTKTNIRKG